MRIFLSEYVCSGAWPETALPGSLAREGRAMLVALLADVSQLPDVYLCTTWDARLGEFPLTTPIISVESAAGINPVARDVGHATIDCIIVRDPHEEADCFRRLAAECDATYVIAPELDDLLTQRCRAVIAAGGRSLNAAPDAIFACSDKWETFQRLSQAGIPTVPTAMYESGATSLPFGFPIVIKPRFGAGSQDTFLVRSRDELGVAAARFPADRPTTEAIIQPYVPGQTLSFAAIVRSDGALRELWPVGEQRLSSDGRFRYLGGTLPSTRLTTGAIANLKSQISELPYIGLRGYVGFDLIVPESTLASPPVFVDINPRLTTSYLGYRALSRVNLAGRILWPDVAWPEPDWRDGPVEFDSDGRVSLWRPAQITPES